MADPKNQHFLLVTFPGQGHINPVLQFAKRLLRATGSQITLSTSVAAHNRMLKHTTNLTSSGLNFAPYSDGHDNGFKANDDIANYMAELKRCGSKTLHEVILAFANQGRPVTRVIYSVLLPWVANVARDLDIPSVLLWNQSAAMFAIFYYYIYNGYRDIILKNQEDPLFSLELPGGLPSLTIRDLPSFFFPSNANEFVISFLEEQFQILEVQDSSTKPTVLLNSFDDLEPEALKSVIHKFNTITIGPLVPPGFLMNINNSKEYPLEKSFGGDLFSGSKDCLEWLNSKEESSVVYVSFGSVAELPKSQVKEIAIGLVESERSFLWVFRGISQENKIKEDGEEHDEELGLLEGRIKEGRGLIVPWCSQVEVLSSASIGCFVTHCGWNSTLESLSAGVPLVACPQWADQTTNAKFLEDVWKTGVRVKQINGEDGKLLVESGELKKSLEMVMEGERSEEMRRNAKKWRDLARKAAAEGGSSEKNLRKFLEKELSY